MRFYSKALLVFSTITILFNSCKNDLNILAPYKESVSVYAILNPQDKRQYVRINKIFLGEGNAYVMAQVTDSVNYKSGVLEVTLERRINGAYAPPSADFPSKTKIILQDSVVQIAPGPFSQSQRLWFTNDSIFSNGDYLLTITNKETGNVFTSKTIMIDSIRTTAFQPLAGPYYPIPCCSGLPWMYLDLSVLSVKHDIRFVTVKDARDYTTVMRFHYRDFGLSGDSTDRYMDYTFGTLSSTSLEGGETMLVSYYAPDFYNALAGKLGPETPNVLKRRAIKMDFIVVAGTQDFVDFLKISAPSTTVAQDKPTYTNITGGGYGIFACRSRLHVSKHLANATLNYMEANKPTCDLKFMDANGSTGSPCN